MKWVFSPKWQALEIDSQGTVEDFSIAKGQNLGDLDLLQVYSDKKNNIREIRTPQNAIIYPQFSVEDSLFVNLGGIKSKIKYRCWVVSSRSEYKEAQNLVNKIHYLNAPNRGIVLACKVLSKNTAIFEKNTAGYSKKYIFDSPISACLFLDRLYFGNPNGRRSIVAKSHIEDSCLQKPRNEIIDILHLSWISRVAVLPVYQRIGLGTVLCMYALDVAARYNHPRSEWVETIRTLRQSELKRMLCKGDFLTRAGFSLHNRDELVDRYINKGRIPRSNGLCKLYYYARTKKI